MRGNDWLFNDWMSCFFACEMGLYATSCHFADKVCIHSANNSLWVALGTKYRIDVENVVIFFCFRGIRMAT